MQHLEVYSSNVKGVPKVTIVVSQVKFEPASYRRLGQMCPGWVLQPRVGGQAFIHQNILNKCPIPCPQPKRWGVLGP